MPIDYTLLTKQSIPQVDLTQAFKTGVGIRGDMIGNQYNNALLKAQQFKNQRAPIDAQNADLLAQANADAKNAEGVKWLAQADAEQKEAQKKFHNDSIGRVASIFSAVQKDDDIPRAINLLKAHVDNGFVDPKVADSFVQSFGDQPMSVGAFQHLAMTGADLKTQYDRMQAEKEAQRKAQADAFDQQYKNRQLNETIRNNKQQNAIGWENAKNKTPQNIVPITADGKSNPAYDAGMTHYLMTGEPLVKGVRSKDTQNIIAQFAGHAQTLLGPESQGVIARNKQIFNSADKTIDQQTKLLKPLENSEKTLYSNMQMLENVAKQINNHSNLPLNKLENKIKYELGDTALAQFQEAVRTVATESASMTSLSNGGGRTTVSGIEEAHKALGAEQTLPQILKVLEYKRAEAKNRVEPIRQSIQDAQNVKDSLANWAATKLNPNYKKQNNSNNKSNDPLGIR